MREFPKGSYTAQPIFACDPPYFASATKSRVHGPVLTLK